jgi:hypothetical protein
MRRGHGRGRQTGGDNPPNDQATIRLASARMSAEGVRTSAICGICGSKYDERTYQVLVPLLRASFDKVECADLGLKKHLRETRRPALEEALFGEVERLRKQLGELAGRV